MLRLLTLTAVSVYNGCQQVVWNSAAYETPSVLLLPIYNCNLKDMWLERFVQKIQFMAIDNKTNSLNNENWDLFMTRFCIGERIFTINFCSIMFIDCIDCIDRHFFWNIAFIWLTSIVYVYLIEFNWISYCNTVFDIYIYSSNLAIQLSYLIWSGIFCRYHFFLMQLFFQMFVLMDFRQVNEFICLIKSCLHIYFSADYRVCCAEYCVNIRSKLMNK